MIALTLIPMIAALGLQAADAVPAEEPEWVERSALQYPWGAAENDVVARCSITLDIRPDGSTTNMCGDCNTASPHDHVKPGRYESSFVRASLEAAREWRFKTTDNGFEAHNQTFDFNLAHLSPDVLASVETPVAPVCD
ncbi:hypothetical protein [Euryhalocaulis caribicus]|uniref:hypothetical protein n=1 Tax=Euryhalocaulis caribicus TaxID=1161401 RepID=UPI00039A6F25|nr:hypothetical protein [Euryhalocaulis caribicus]